MSYSFQIAATTKDQAGKLVEEELGKVVAAQPVHDNDRQQAQDAAEALINLLVEPKEGECIRIYMSGSLGWVADNAFTNANVSVQVSISPTS